MVIHRKVQPNVVHRWEGNPVLRAEQLPFYGADLHNAGAVRHGGKYILLLTVEAAEGRHAIYRAESEDGLHFEIAEEPFLEPSEDGPFAPYEEDGVQDPRITRMDGTYYVVYGTMSPYGDRLAVARTDDFRRGERISFIGEPDTKAGALFPEKVNGRYALLMRPREGNSIWFCQSDDLRYWGSFKPVMGPRGGYWDFHRIGTGPPPIRTERGWLLIYYGQKFTSGGPLFRLGSAILDPENPSRVLGRANIPILSPREEYERVGDVNNLVYCCGAVLEDEGRLLRIYYGAAQSCICTGTVALEDVCDRCFKPTEEA